MEGEKSSTARNKLIKTRSKLKLKGITLSHHLFKGWDTSKIGMSSGRCCEAAEDRKGADELHAMASVADHFLSRRLYLWLATCCLIFTRSQS